MRRIRQWACAQASWPGIWRSKLGFMRILFSVLGLLVVVMVIGIVAKKQLAAVNQPLALPVATGNPPAGTPPAGALVQSPQSAASQVKQSVDAMLQQPRPTLEEK